YDNGHAVLLIISGHAYVTAPALAPLAATPAISSSTFSSNGSPYLETQTYLAQLLSGGAGAGLWRYGDGLGWQFLTGDGVSNGSYLGSSLWRYREATGWQLLNG